MLSYKEEGESSENWGRPTGRETQASAKNFLHSSSNNVEGVGDPTVSQIS